MTNHSEERPIPGFPGYVITSGGDVVSYTLGKRRVLQPQLDRHGYLTVRLTRFDGSTPRRPHLGLHRLMLLAFVGEPVGDARVARHLNGNRRDNRLENLAWGTYSDNMDDAIRHGTAAFLHRKPGDTKPSNVKLTEAQVREIEARSWAGESQRSLGREFGVAYRHVHGIKHHEYWKHLWPESKSA